jgi:hypothetical protein
MKKIQSAIFILGVFIQSSYGQAEMEPWGNLSGIRVDGQLMAFKSSLNILGKDGSQMLATALERQRPKYNREGNTQVVRTNLDSSYFTEKVEDIGPGQVRIDLQFNSRANTNMGGAFFCMELREADYAAGSIQLIDPSELPLSGGLEGGQHELMRYPAKGVRFISQGRQLELRFDDSTLVIVKNDSVGGEGRIRLYLPVHLGEARAGENAHKAFTIRISGSIDKTPLHLALNTAVNGRAFDGLGGNFRIQNPKLDPEVIDYCLSNLRVAWGRVEMPWAFWQPVKDSNPIDSGNAGKLNPRVITAMQMAQRLGKMGIPVILSAWFPPRWAIVGEPNFRHAGGVWGNPLDKANTEAIYKSITDYILFVKKNYGVEVKLFSFNESDLGINIRITAAEHDELMKGLGAYFAAHGLKTKMLLGDNSDANTYAFIYPAMADPAARPYIGAISFHSWRGWETATLEKWADAAKQMNVPLLVGEGSIDAAAWNYPAIFLEPTYALQEINLYVRILAICQPLSILQWQLTTDYSPLSGGGIFGNDAPLAPTRRFWNLKQLASTPKGLLAMPISSDQADVSCAALGNNAKNKYAIHLVNNGAAREVTLTGLSKKTRGLRIFVTDRERSMKEGAMIPVSEGQAHFTLDAVSYTTLISE